MRTRLLSVVVPGLLAAVLGCPGPSPQNNNNGGGGDAGPEPTESVCTVDGVDVAFPAEAAVRKDGQAPVLDCLSGPTQLPAGQDVTVEGCIDIFGIGSKAKPTLKVAVFGIDQDPRADTPRYGETDVAVASQPGDLQALADACATDGFYRLAGVPTNTPLIFKVYDTDEGAAQTAIPTYSYYSVLADEDVEGGVVTYAANLVYKTTYDSIPTLGGKRIDGQQIIYDGVGRGVIAGEIRDCEGVTVKNAAVSSSLFDNSTKLAYFNGAEDPQPDLTRKTTNDDGLYVVLNAATDEGANEHIIAAGILDPACAGDDCQCIGLGSGAIRVFPDSVTILSIEGLNTSLE